MSSQSGVLRGPAAGSESVWSGAARAAPADGGRGERKRDGTIGPGLPAERLIPFLRFYAHQELPRYGQLLNRYGMNDQPRWAGAGVVEARERFHGFRMRLDLSDFYQRIA